MFVDSWGMRLWMLPQSFLLCEVLTLVIDHFLFYFRLSLQAFLAYHIFLMCHHLSDTSFILFRLISTHMYVYSIHSFYTSHLFFFGFLIISPIPRFVPHSSCVGLDGFRFWFPFSFSLFSVFSSVCAWVLQIPQLNSIVLTFDRSPLLWGSLFWTYKNNSDIVPQRYCDSKPIFYSRFTLSGITADSSSLPTSSGRGTSACLVTRNHSGAHNLHFSLLNTFERAIHSLIGDSKQQVIRFVWIVGQLGDQGMEQLSLGSDFLYGRRFGRVGWFQRLRGMQMKAVWGGVVRFLGQHYNSSIDSR